MTEISAMYEALDNMDDYALMAGIKPTGPHKVLTDAIAELETLRQRVAELEEDRDRWREDCQTYCDTMHKREEAITSLQAERDKATQYWSVAEGRCDALIKEVAHWKNNHATEVRRARILKERTDMPIERVQAYEQWGKDMAERDALLEANRIACTDIVERHNRIVELKQQRDELVTAAQLCIKENVFAPLMEAIASVKEKA